MFNQEKRPEKLMPQAEEKKDGEKEGEGKGEEMGEGGEWWRCLVPHLRTRHHVVGYVT